jgi:hypothetical protein
MRVLVLEADRCDVAGCCADDLPAVPTSEVVAVLPLPLDPETEPPSVVTDAAVDGCMRDVGERRAEPSVAVRELQADGGWTCRALRGMAKLDVLEVARGSKVH